MPPMSLRKKAIKGVFWSLVQKWGMEFLSLLTFVVLSRLLEPKAFGLVSMALIFLDFIQILLDQGFSAAIIQRSELEEKHLDTAFWTSLLTGVLLTLIGTLAARPIAEFFKEPQLTSIVIWLSFSLLISAFSSTQQAILSRKLAFQSLALRSLGATLVGGIVGVGMALWGFGVWSLVISNLVNSLVGTLLLWSVSDWHPGFSFSKKHFQELFSYGVHVIGSKILTFFNRRTDDLLIGSFLGATMLGYYTIAYRLLLVMIKLLTSVTNSVAFPAFSRLQLEPERMRRAFYQVTQLTSFISFPTFFGLLVLAPELLPTLFGSKWLPSVPVMQILALIGILQSIQTFNGSVLKAAGKPDWYLKIMLLTSICNVIGFLCVVRWGIIAVATSFVVIGYLLAPIYLLTVNKILKLDLKTYFCQYLPPLIASLGMAAIILGLKFMLREQLLYIQLPIYIISGALAYLVIIRLASYSLYQEVLQVSRLALGKTK